MQGLEGSIFHSGMGIVNNYVRSHIVESSYGDNERRHVAASLPLLAMHVNGCKPYSRAACMLDHKMALLLVELVDINKFALDYYIKRVKTSVIVYDILKCCIIIVI